MSGRVTMSNEQLVTVREAMRDLNRMVDRLHAGDVDAFVLMKHNRMVAAVVPLATVATDGAVRLNDTQHVEAVAIIRALLQMGRDPMDNPDAVTAAKRWLRENHPEPSVYMAAMSEEQQ